MPGCRIFGPLNPEIVSANPSHPTRGLVILVAPVSGLNAIHSRLTKRITQFTGKFPLHSLGLTRHGRPTRQIRPTRQPERFPARVSGISQRRADGVLNPAEQSIREEILSGLLADKGGAAQISTAIRVLAEIIASDVSLLVMSIMQFDGVIENNPKSKSKSQGIGALDGYKRPLMGSLSANLQRFGMERVAEVVIASGDHRGNE